MELTIRRAVLSAALLSVTASGQQQQLRRTIDPPDIFDDRSVDVARIAPDRCRVEIDNERMRVLRMTVPANSRVPIHGHRPGVLVALKELQLRIVRSNGDVIDVRLPAGDMRWLDAGVHSEENVGTSAAEYLYIEAKN